MWSVILLSHTAVIQSRVEIVLLPLIKMTDHQISKPQYKRGQELLPRNSLGKGHFEISYPPPPPWVDTYDWDGTYTLAYLNTRLTPTYNTYTYLPLHPHLPTYNTYTYLPLHLHLLTSSPTPTHNTYTYLPLHLHLPTSTSTPTYSHLHLHLRTRTSNILLLAHTCAKEAPLHLHNVFIVVWIWYKCSSMNMI